MDLLLNGELPREAATQPALSSSMSSMQIDHDYSGNSRRQTQEKVKKEPLATNERYRVDDLPSGIKNIGNTCYFSSVVQVIVHLPNITEKICTFQVKDFDDYFEKLKDNKDIENDEKVKMMASRDFVTKL